MNKNDAKALMDKYLSGQATPEEKVLLERLYNKVLKERLQTGKQPDYSTLKAALDKKLSEPNRRPVIRRLAPYGIAASIMLCMITAMAIYKFTQNRTTIEYTQNDRAPGGNKATLTLADGRTIALSEAQSGIVVNGQRITYQDSTAEIVSLPAETANELILHTPKGGQYQITLPDGTQVWLNAASSLTYPANFASRKERRVRLIGEAYFEVAKNEKQPFIVASQDQEVKVLGTHFNINGYTDEATIKTTLLEGSVQVSVIGEALQMPIRSVLIPGQQAILSRKTLQVKQIDAEEAVAWKNDMFLFNDEPLESVMRKIARWYDVEIIYQGDLRAQEIFAGSIARYENLSRVLRMLEEVGDVHFKLEGRRLTVMK